MTDLEKERRAQRLTAAELPPPYVPTLAEQAFIDGLNELTARTGIKVEGCGCCGSPWLMDGASAGHYEVSNDAVSLRWVANNG